MSEDRVETWSLWKDSSDRYHRTICMANCNNRDGYPTVVICEDIDTGEKLSIPLEDWNGQMTRVTD